MSYRVSGFNIVIATTAGVRTVGRDHPCYIEICRALESGDMDKIPELLDVKARLLTPLEKLSTTVEIVESADGSSSLTIDGLKVHGRAKDLILQFRKRGIPFTALQLFWGKLRKNPLLVGKESLLEFLSANNVPLLPNGNFLAYKGVVQTSTPNVFRSTHDPTFLYEIGKVAEIARERCTVDTAACCGPGLHVGGFEHAVSYGDTLIDCEVDPADVTSVPSAENSKLRACRVLPVRVNATATCYATDYVDLRAGLRISENSSGATISVRANTKRGGGRTPKTTWYKLVGSNLLRQRKCKCPGEGWLSIRPIPGNAASGARPMVIKSAVIRTWYRRNANGEITRTRSATRPAGFSSHKPR